MLGGPRGGPGRCSVSCAAGIHILEAVRGYGSACSFSTLSALTLLGFSGAEK